MQAQNSTISLLSTREYTKSFYHNKRLNVGDNNVSQEPAKKIEMVL